MAAQNQYYFRCTSLCQKSAVFNEKNAKNGLGLSRRLSLDNSARRRGRVDVRKRSLSDHGGAGELLV
jgi:hypothetical protein